MFCEKCGNKGEDNEKFCTHCGSMFSRTEDGSLHEKKASQTPHVNKKRFFSLSGLGKLSIVLFIIGLSIWGSLDDDVVETNNEALTNLSSGNTEQAIAQLQQASSDAVKNEIKIDTLKNLAYVYASENEDVLALSTFKEAFSLTTEGSFDYYLISGEIALLEGKANAALVGYNKAYEINSNSFQINNALALFYIDIDEIAPQYVNYPKAIKYAQRAYELSDELTKSIAVQNLAVAYFFDEDYDKAISLFHSLDLNSEPYLFLWLGLAYVYSGDDVNGKLYLQKAVNADAEVSQEIYDYLYQ